MAKSVNVENAIKQERSSVIEGGVLRLVIPDTPPSLNKVLRMHWATKRKLNQNWVNQVWAASYCCRPFDDLYEEKAKVKITLHHARAYDQDNAYGACKTVLDALRRSRLIRDDTAEWLELTVEQEKCKHRDRHTVIELEPA